jgi:hypothetical protein
MAKPRGNPNKLVPFKPGEDSRRNTYGANAGSQSLGSILDRLLAKKTVAVDDGEAITVTKKEAIAIEMIRNAILAKDPNVQLKAAKQIFENTDPIIKLVDYTGTVDTTINLDKLSTEEKRTMLALLSKAENE